MKPLEEVKDINTYMKDQAYGDYSKTVTVEHRSGNTKREFLFVNKHQCKHIPADPEVFTDDCKKLSEIINGILDKKATHVMVVGFAETATAVASLVTKMLHKNAWFTCTTREDVPGTKELIRFEEEHSHATTQKLLVSEDLDFNKKVFDRIDYILFIDDEISTGKTVLNFIDAFEKQLNTDENGKKKKKIKYGVASFYNWQSEKDRKGFEDLHIDVVALTHGELINKNIKMFKDFDKEPLVADPAPYKMSAEPPKVTIKKIRDSRLDMFKVNRTGAYNDERSNKSYDDAYHAYDFRSDDPKIGCIYDLITKLEDEIFNDLAIEYCGHSIRIIGTEEFMDFPITLGNDLKVCDLMSINDDIADGRKARAPLYIRCHATTRSKIDVIESYFDGVNDGIKSRYKVPSAYDSERDTYIYNMDEYYDLTVVISDTKNEKQFTQLISELALICRGRTKMIVGYLV